MLNQNEVDVKVQEILRANGGSIPADKVLEIAELYQKAQNDDTPFAVVKEDSMSVVGNANKTEIKKIDITMGFRTPIEVYERKNVKAGNSQVVGPYYIYEIEYKDRYITPRDDHRIVYSLLQLVPFFLKIKEDNEGSLEFADNMDLMRTLAFAPQDLILAMYNVAGAFIGIDDELGEWMLPNYVYNVVAEFFKIYPEAINEADVFFGLSISGR